jgi:hypothetical protein
VFSRDPKETSPHARNNLREIFSSITESTNMEIMYWRALRNGEYCSPYDMETKPVLSASKINYIDGWCKLKE